jgi:hypothetical protein
MWFADLGPRLRARAGTPVIRAGTSAEIAAVAPSLADALIKPNAPLLVPANTNSCIAKPNMIPADGVTGQQGAPTRVTSESESHQRDSAGVTLVTLVTSVPPTAELDEVVPDSVAQRWREAIARIEGQDAPARVRSARWQQFIKDANTFIEEWAARATADGWDAVCLFGVLPEAPEAAIHVAGLVWLLQGDNVVAITASTASIMTRSGAIQTYYRRPSIRDAIPAWDLCNRVTGVTV